MQRGIGHYPETRSGDRALVPRIDQQPVPDPLHDLRRAAAAGRDHGHARGGRLEQREAERFVEGRIDEDSTVRRASVQCGNVGGVVPIGQGNAPGECRVGSERAQVVLDGVLLRRRTIAPLAREDDEVGRLHQRGRSGIGAKQRGDVLLGDRARHQKDDGLVGAMQIAIEPIAQRTTCDVAAARHPRRNANHPARRMRDFVGGHLTVGLIAGREDDRVGATDRGALGLDATVEIDHARGTRPLVDPECMRRVDEGNTQPIPDDRGHGGGVGEMRVDDVGQVRQAREKAEEGLGEGGQIRLQRLFLEVATICRGDPNDRQIVVDLGNRLRMFVAQRWVLEQPGHDLHDVYVGAGCLSARSVEDVGDVPTRISRNSITDGRCPQAAPQCQMNDIQCRALLLARRNNRPAN